MATEETSEVGPARAQEVPNLFNLIRLTPVQVGLKPIPVGLKPIPIHKGTPPTHDNHSPGDNHSPLQPSSPSLFTNMPYTHLPEVSKSLSSSSSHYQLTHQRKTISSQYHSSLKSDHATQLNTTHLPRNLKRKGINDELDTIAKRIKQAINSTETIYFDPGTAAFIPQSKLEYFILHEGQKTEDKAHNSKYFSQKLPATNPASTSEWESFPSMADEAGLIMPPPPQ